MKQQHVAALVSEAIGTFVLMLVVLSVGRLGYPFFTAIAAGVTVAAFVSAFSKISGGHFNPAITVGQWAIRTVSATRAIAYIVVQCLAAVAGAWLFMVLIDTKLNFTIHTTLDWRVFIAEALGSFIFAVAVASVVTQKLDGHQAAFTVGAGLFLGLVVASLVSLAVLNPALGFGLAVGVGIDLNYILGPLVGSIIGFGLVATVISPMVKSGLTKKAPAVVTVSAPTAAEVEKTEVKAETKKSVATKTAKKSTAKKSTSKKASKK